MNRIKVTNEFWLNPNPQIIYSAPEDKIFLLYDGAPYWWVEDGSGGLKEMQSLDGILMEVDFSNGRAIVLGHLRDEIKQGMGIESSPEMPKDNTP